MNKKFYAEGTAVRFADGKPCCVTSHSIHLDINPDPTIGYAEKSWDKREGMATIIAEALNLYFANRQAPAPQSHVVAWKYEKNGKVIVTTHDQPWKANTGWKITPLGDIRTPSPQPNVRVKSLEWRKFQPKHRVQEETIADTPFGRYSIVFIGEWQLYWNRSRKPMSKYESAIAAMDAAQADHDRRVLALISTRTRPPQPNVEYSS